MRIKFWFGLIYVLLLSGCSSGIEGFDIKPPIPEKKIPFQFQILDTTREVIMTQEYSWESQVINYYNVQKVDSVWEMWYTGWGKNDYNDYYGAFCYAFSLDGAKWIKSIPSTKSSVGKFFLNNNIIMSLKAGSPIVEQFVFYDPIVLEYRMIGVTSNNGIIGTFIYSSKDGIDWKKEKLLFDSYMDAHFSVVIKDNLYIVYHRTIFNGRRAVGRFVLDNNYNILEEPKLVLVSPYNDFAHVYNSAASLIKNKILFFPTMYDSNKDMMYISVGYEDNNEFFLTDLNITEKLYKGENIKWGIVMPGLIQTSESDIFWLYYEGSTYPHNERRQAIDNISRYYRIKIKITTQ